MPDQVGGQHMLWRDRLPWLILLRTFRPAVSVRLLFCSAAGLLGMIAGWRLIFWYLFYGSSDPLIAALRRASIGTPWPAWPWEAAYFEAFGYAGVVSRIAELPYVGRILADVAAHVLYITLPFQFLFTVEGLGVAGLAFVLLCGMWSLAVWAFFGGVMTRTVALRLAREESISWRQAAGFARGHWVSYFTAPLYPLLGILLVTLPILVLGLIARLDIGAVLIGLIWPLALLGGLLMAILLLGLFFGWPLMWGTISVEGTDAFDALSRSYAYVFQRPLKYLGYAIVAIVLGILGWILVQYFAQAVIWLSFWAASWGAGNARIETLTQSLKPQAGILETAVSLFQFWRDLVLLIASAFALSFFWSATTGIYLLLRRDVDAAEMDEVHLDQDEAFTLPPLEQDAAGVPGAADAPLGTGAPATEPGGDAPGSSLHDEE